MSLKKYREEGLLNKRNLKRETKKVQLIVILFIFQETKSDQIVFNLFLCPDKFNSSSLLVTNPR